MTLENYGKLKSNVGIMIYRIVQEEQIGYEEVMDLINLYESCGGSMEKIQNYLKILNMYDDKAARDLLITPSLLLSIDNIDKEMSYIVRFSELN